MSDSHERENPSSRTVPASPAMLGGMILGNVVLLACLVGLGLLAWRTDQRSGLPRPLADANQRIVNDSIAEWIRSGQYRVCEWYPAQPLQGSYTILAGQQWQPVQEKGVAQRVRLRYYGSHRADDLDLVYWVQDGKVTRKMEAKSFRFPDEPVSDWSHRTN